MSLKKFLDKIWGFIAGIFHKLDEGTKKLLPVVIKVVDAIKQIDDTHIGDVIASIIPGTADDKIIKKLHEILPKVIANLNIANAISGIEDPNEKLKAILTAINVSPADTKKVFYKGLATLILEKLADGKFSFADAVAVSEYYYQNQQEIENPEPVTKEPGAPNPGDVAKQELENQ